MNDPQKYIENLRKLYDDRKIGVSGNSPLKRRIGEDRGPSHQSICQKIRRSSTPK